MKAIIFISDDCKYCEKLKQDLDMCDVPYTVTYTNPTPCHFLSTPGTFIPEGSGASGGRCVGYPDNDWQAQSAAIKEAYSKTTVHEPIKIKEEDWEGKPNVWSNDLSVKWGGVQLAYDEKKYEEKDLDTTDPIPPEMPIGLTIALRSHKKARMSR